MLAARLARDLGGMPVALYTSDLQRATQTAAHIAAALAVTPVPDPRLREWNNGDAANLSLDEARQRFPGAFDAPWHADDRPFPNCETFRDFYLRAAAALDEIDRAHGSDGDKRLPVIVTHGGTIECLVVRWLRLPPDRLSAIGFHADPTSIATLIRDRFGRPRLHALNDTAHLTSL